MSIMSWSRLNKLSAIAITSLGGGSLLCSLFSNESRLKTVYNASSFTSSNSSSPEWDYNWDHRAPSKVIKSSELTKGAKDFKLEGGKATRNVILIRHGQYNLRGATDIERYLSDLGRIQAKRTGERLSELEIPFDEVVMSTMTRAQQTGNIIVDQLSKPQRQNLKIINEPLIEEGAPVEPIPRIDYWNPEPFEFFQEGARIEAGFRKYIHRADPSQKDDSFSLLVCHGNVIRYMVCRALQLPPEAWLRFNIHHASITWLVMYPNGRVVVRLYGDCGHMGKNQVTLS